MRAARVHARGRVAREFAQAPSAAMADPADAGMLLASLTPVQRKALLIGELLYGDQQRAAADGAAAALLPELTVRSAGAAGGAIRGIGATVDGLHVQRAASSHSCAPACHGMRHAGEQPTTVRHHAQH